MKGKAWLMGGAVAVMSIAGAVGAHDRDRGRNHRVVALALLTPSEEVPVLSSQAKGLFRATIDEEAQTITYEVRYEGLEGNPLQAHIHIGQRSVNGGISVYLCGNPPNVPAAPAPTPPTCPAAPAVVTGVLTFADIVGPAAQGVAASTDTVNEFEELVDMLTDGLTYANVHSSKFPGGEIRGQIKVDQYRR
jgi:hypothetical protein